MSGGKKKHKNKGAKKPPLGKQGVRVYFFVANFRHLATQKKKGWRIQQRDFLRIKKNTLPYLENKEV
jgi:hypothetical protein